MPSPPMSSPVAPCTSTTPRCRSWHRALARPRPGDYGPTSETSGPLPVRGRRRLCSAIRRTARANIHRAIGRIVEAACWAHVRRKFFDVHAATASPIAKEALDRIGQLYAVEKTINGSLPDRRRQERQRRSKPIAEALSAWAESTVRQLSRKSELAQAFRYMRARWTALMRCFDDGRLALDNNPAERALRCVAVRRSLCPSCSSVWKHWKL